MDALIHGWDIARATGQDARMEPDLVAPACMPIAQQLTAMAWSSGVFGEDLSVAPEAESQTRFAGAGRSSGLMDRARRIRRIT